VLEPSRLEQSLAHRLLTLEADALQSRLLRAGITILPWHVARPLSSLLVLGGSRA
jgi:hypothetical protein